MIRALLIVAAAGLVMSVAFISGAVALGGPDALARSAFSWNFDHDWDMDDDHHVWRHGAAPTTVQNGQDFPWSGDRLEVNAPAEIDYLQAPGPARLTIRAPAEVLRQVQVANGRITLPGAHGRSARLSISLTAPDVKRFELNGADRLAIRGYKQDELDIKASGRAEIRAEGEAKTVNLEVSGHGEADLGALKTQGAEIEISGAGEATARPTEWARVHISGVGEVELLTRPKSLATDIAGAGRVRQPEEGRAPSANDEDDERGPPRPT